jgi:hypothetical protein
MGKLKISGKVKERGADDFPVKKSSERAFGGQFQMKPLPKNGWPTGVHLVASSELCRRPNRFFVAQCGWH